MARRIVLAIVPTVFAFLSACGSSSAPTNSGPSGTAPVQPTKADVKAPELGTGDHSPDSVTFTEIAVASAGLKTPRDLAFNPVRPDELWVVNLGDESAVIIHDASTDGRTTERRKDADAAHFMAKPSALAFGQDATTIGKLGTFATCGESRDTMDDTMPARDFMGPALWSSDPTVFAKQNPHQLGSHLDMLHCSPLCVGIAHETGNAYWTFAGKTNSIVRYDFHKDNGIGNDDHSDGEAADFVRGQVKYSKGIPSHLFFNDTDGMLYIADTGNARIVKLDPKSGKRGADLTPMEPMDAYYKVDSAALTDVVSADSGAVQSPSGLEIKNDFIYVSDNATSRITAFTLTGEQVNYLDTGLPAGSLSGMNFGPDGKLYFVDMIGNRVVRIDSK